jgi:hypothetical protein
MANVNIRTPRFYIDWINYAMSRGTAQDNNYDVISTGDLLAPSSGTEAELFDMRPLNQVGFNTSNVVTKKVLITIDSESDDGIIPFDFIAILNHNLKTCTGRFIIGASNTEAHINNEDFDTGHTVVQPSAMVNSSIGNEANGYPVSPARDGTTIVTFTDPAKRFYGIQFEGDAPSSGTWNGSNNLLIGGIMLGQFYDMPRSPDLSVKRSIIFNNVSIQESLGGQRYATMSNHGRKGSSQNLSPFQIDTNKWGSQGGRMSYDMKFSYLNSTDVMPDDYSSIDRDDDAVINDVWNMTSGNHTPFIFTTDKTSTAESDYLFARFGQNSFDMTQVAPDVFNISLKIEEEF